MRALVTGAAGFIGSHVVDRLLAEGHEVIGVDDLSSGRNQLPAPADFHRLDVASPSLTALAADRRPEVICHLAAQVSVRASVADPLHDARVNVLGTLNVLEAARAAGASTVFASSCAVYGMPESLPVRPGVPLRPLSPYAASKVAGEVYHGMYHSLHGVGHTTLTLANVYGPRQSPDGEAGVISIFTDALLAGRPTRIYGTGENTRDYVYVGDVARAFVRAATSGEPGTIRRFDIGTGVQTTDRDLHTLVAELAGAPDTPEAAPPRPGDLPAMALDPAAARAGLGWAPEVSLREGLAATVHWARGR